MAINRDIYLKKVNRNFNMQVRLYFNDESYNREVDPLPRYFLEPSKLNYVERVAFTEEGARAKKFVKVSRRMYAGKSEQNLSDTEMEAIFEDIKKSYPYGYVTDNIASTNKYNLDFKYNQAYQSHLTSYWIKHKEEIIHPKEGPYGWRSEHPHKAMPYIEVTIDEIVKYKYTEGPVPALTDPSDGWAEYAGLSETWTVPHAICTPESIDISIGTYDGRNVFLDDDIESPIFVVNSGNTYTFNMVSPWTGYPDGTLVNWPLKFSTGYDGTLVEGNEEYTDGVTYNGVHGDEGSSVSIAITSETPAHLYYYGPSGDMGGYLYMDKDCTY